MRHGLAAGGVRARPILLVGSLITVAGCAGLLGFEEFVGGTAPPDGGEAGAIDAGPTDGLEEADADWYVSPAGDDDADGSRAHPLRSLRAATVRAEGALRKKAPQRIAVCAGDYVIDPLAVTGRVEVRGGWDCRAWRRPIASDERIGALPSATKLANAKPAETIIALGRDASGAPLLDRLELVGKDVTTVINAVGDTVLTDLTVTNTTVPSPENGIAQLIGVAVSGSTETADVEPRVERCTVAVLASFGDAKKAEPTATGISLLNSRHRVTRNSAYIAGVKGTGAGVVILKDSVATVADNVVQIASCTAPAKGVASELGLAVVDSKVTSERNAFLFEAPGNADPTAPARVIGLSVRGAGTVASDGDRVVGPSALDPDHRSRLLTFKGFEDVDGSLVRVVNGSIVLDSHAYVLDNSAGIYFTAPTAAVVAHNSMYFTLSGAEPAAPVPLRGVVLSNVAVSDAGASALTIASNLVATDDPRMTFLYARCDLRGIAALAHNRYAGFDASAAGINCTTGRLDELWPDAGADGNVPIACPSDGGCATLFASVISAGSDGLALTDAGCALATGIPSRSDVPVDGAGRSRGATTTAGAFACE